MTERSSTSSTAAELDDDFYDTDQDAIYAEAAKICAYDPTTRPFTSPVCPASSGGSKRRSYQQAMGSPATPPSTPTTTLFDRPLGLRLCAQTSQSVTEEQDENSGAYDLTKRSPFALPVCTTNGSSNVSRRRSYREGMGASPTPSTPTATLSGRPLGSRLCATASQSVIQTCRTPVFDDEVAATAAIQLEQQQQQQSSHNSSRSSSGMEEEKQITKTVPVVSFVRASFFYGEAKQKFTQPTSTTSESEDEEEEEHQPGRKRRRNEPKGKGGEEDEQFEKVRS